MKYHICAQRHISEDVHSSVFCNKNEGKISKSLSLRD